MFKIGNNQKIVELSQLGDISSPKVEYVVEEVLGRKKTNGQVRYLLKWKGYDHNEKKDIEKKNKNVDKNNTINAELLL